MFKKKKPETRLGRRQPYTATQSRPAFSYHAQRQRAEDGNPRSRLRPDDSIQLSGSSLRVKLRAVVRANIVGVFTAAALVVLLVINALVSVKDPRIVVHGTPDQRVLLYSAKSYEDEARAILTSSPLYRFKVTADTDAFAREFPKKHPEIASAQLRFALFGQRPEVYITPATPALELVSSAAASNTYIIDTTGRVIQAAEPGKLSLPRLQDQSGYQVREGAQALSSRDISFILRLQNQLDAKGIQVKAYSIPPSSRQLHLQVEGKKYNIKYTFENDVLQQAGAHIAVQQKLDSIKVVPVEYIDVRVADRVYYK
jgi:hypothetical protein